MDIKDQWHKRIADLSEETITTQSVMRLFGQSATCSSIQSQLINSTKYLAVSHSNTLRSSREYALYMYPMLYHIQSCVVYRVIYCLNRQFEFLMSRFPAIFPPFFVSSFFVKPCLNFRVFLSSFFLHSQKRKKQMIPPKKCLVPRTFRRVAN